MLRLFVVQCLIVLSQFAMANDTNTVYLGDSELSMHPYLGGQPVRIEPAFEDYAFMLFDLCDAMGLNENSECLIYPMTGDIGGNAIATVYNGDRLIVYDRKLSQIIGFAGASMVIAHELGHHYCGHLNEKPKEYMELQADTFAGAAMRKSGFTLQDALAATVILSERPSKSHPSRQDRIAAIAAGWTNPETGKNCRK